jgi:hypothetical protein
MRCQVLVPCIASHLAIQDHELAEFLSGSSAVSASAAAHSVGIALMTARPIENFQPSTSPPPQLVTSIKVRLKLLQA